MKTIYNTRIYVMSTAPMTDEEIEIIENNLSEKFHGRLKISDATDNNQLAYIDLISNENPKNDELADFITQTNNCGVQTFWGMPNDEFSNIITNYELSYLADI